MSLDNMIVADRLGKLIAWTQSGISDGSRAQFEKCIDKVMLHAPSPSRGYNCGITRLDASSKPDRLVFVVPFLRYDSNGFVLGWRDYRVIATPRFFDISVRVTGREWQGTKQYLKETFYNWLSKPL
jgi:hypothetical protein